MITLPNFKLSTDWGTVCQELNNSFRIFNEGKVDSKEGFSLMSDEQARKLEDLEKQVNSDLLEEDDTLPSFILGKEEFIAGIITLAEKVILNQVKPITLYTIPNDSTISYEVDGISYDFYIGQEVRVIYSGDISFYKLKNIIHVGNTTKAEWVISGQGGGGGTAGDGGTITWYDFVKPEDIVILTGLSFSIIEQNIEVDDSGVIKVGEVNLNNLLVYDPSNATDKEVIFTANDPDVVIKDGIIIGFPKTYKDFNITGTAMENPELTVSMVIHYLKYIPPVVPESIQINTEPNTKIEKGGTLNLSFEVLPINTTNKTIIWTSNHPEIAEIDSDAIITAISPGEFIIEGKSVVDELVKSNITLKVKVTPTQLNITNKGSGTISLPLNDTITLLTSIVPTDSTEDLVLAWDSTNDVIATVSQSGIVTAKSIGNCVITVTNGSLIDTVSISVS